jgi:hypothetical protein
MRFTDADVASRRVVVALPQPPVQAVDATAVQTAVYNALTERNEEVLTTLREAWDGDSFTEHEINSVLSNLGLGDIAPTETVTVTVTVTGRSDLDSSDIEAMIEGEFSVSLNETVQASWTIEGLDFDVDTRSGECGCGEVSRTMVQDRLYGGSVTYEQFDFETTCSNC